MASAKPSKEKTLDELIRELESQVEKLEGGNMTVDESIKAYMEGMSTAVKCKAMLEEMRDYLKEGDFSEEFVPSDYDADNDCLVKSITYADEALSDEDVAEPEAEEEEVTEEKSEGNDMAAMAVGAVVIFGVCAYVIYRRKKA